MKVLLQKDIQGIGRKGEIKNVADGYYRNFLLPKSLALPVNESVYENLEQQKIREEKNKEKRKALIESSFGILDTNIITIKSKVDEKGHMFGSVNALALEKELKKQNIDLLALRGKIHLPHPIKEKGSHAVEIIFEGGEKKFITVIIEKQS